ncbi:uncharacterized protein LOC111050695 [Nilaparvata lugens]|uniref:uncharacterized protein LOC111050695 n=1 Tax=Nilaparvata lugens TaxID=108931 RepID=UPI00193E338C|nr:uncharacterized protein LOC111050695 [Nilaparvata lugens]
MENKIFPNSMNSIDRASKGNFPQSIGDGKYCMNLCNGDTEIKNEEDSTIFNFDSLNLSQPESDTSRDVELSRSFDFFLEGERLVSSLCGPKIEEKNSRNTSNDRSSDKCPEHGSTGLFEINDEKYIAPDRFLSSLMPITVRESDCLSKNNMIDSTDKDSQSKALTRNPTEHTSREFTEDKTESQMKMPTFLTDYPSSNMKDEFKAKPYFKNSGLIRRSPILDLRKSDDGNHPGRKLERFSLFKMNDLEVKIPFQYDLLESKNKIDFPALSAGGSDDLHCSEAETKILTRSNDYALCFTDNSKNIGNKCLGAIGCNQTGHCDDEISFRKSAIGGCLMFEQIIRDFQLKSNECDLESYCRTVKRCVSIANNLENTELVSMMTQMILCSLKLADSWSTLNSYFGTNSKQKQKSEDDCHLLQLFKQWQVGSKSILDCLLVVIQNLKSCIPKVENPTNKSSAKPATETNPFLNMKKLQFDSGKSVFQSDKEKSSSSIKQQQGNQPGNSRMSHFFDCINSKNTSLPQENNDPSNLLLEIQQKAQSLVTTKKTTEEKKTKKKWIPPSLENKIPNAASNRISGQGIGFTAPNQTEQPMTLFNSSLSTPMVNKSIFENVPIPTMNLMFNPFNTAIQNTTVNANSKDYNAIPHINFMYPQTGMNLNSKPAVQDKDANNILKSHELPSQSSITNQIPGLNRNNLLNQQQMSLIPFQPNFNYQPFSFPNDQKNEFLYRTNYCFPDGKMMPLQSGGPPQPPTAPFFYPSFCGNAMHQMDNFNNKFIHNNDKRQKSLVENSDGDENSEGFYEIKSYMKPGSYKVPNKNTFNTATPNDNLNYIFEDIVVTGIAVPLTKTESFSPSKKTNSKTIVTAKKSPPSGGSKPRDSVWRAAVASAEAIGKLVENLKQPTSQEATDGENGGSNQGSSKASATESALCSSSETDSKEGDSPSKSE